MNKYIISLSVLVNGILIMMVVGVFPFLLFLAALFCVGLVWYIGRLLSQLRECVEDLATARNTIMGFGHHVEAVHELEMYYGDETLGALITHSRNCVQELDSFVGKYSPYEELLDDEEA
jgi:hypothetical protein